MSHANAYLPDTRTSGRGNVTVMLEGGYQRHYEDHFVRIDGTSGVLGVFEPEERRPVVTTSLANAVIEWTETA